MSFQRFEGPFRQFCHQIKTQHYAKHQKKPFGAFARHRDGLMHGAKRRDFRHRQHQPLPELLQPVPNARQHP